ncbi:MAG: hypothetical protein HY560_04985 [Gemmatimonadetes bacterium]|nr:hypothetical protein [Gemmatimonadota bacterium]
MLPIALISLAPAALRAQVVAYEGNISLATGSYFYATRTTSWTLATGIAYTPGRLILRAAAPVYLQNSSLTWGAGAGMMPFGTGAGGSAGTMSSGGGTMGRGAGMMSGGTTGSGGMAPFRAALGDPTVQAAWRVLSGGRTGLTVGAGAKIPATDTTDYGTGKWDVGGMLSFTRQVGAALLFGVDLSYWRLGDLPTFRFSNPVVGTISAGRVFANTWGVSLLVTAGTSAIPGYTGPVSVGATLTRLGKSRLWGLSAAVGFTQTVPDFSVGASWRIGL